jgi:hypothetical protein
VTDRVGRLIAGTVGFWLAAAGGAFLLKRPEWVEPSIPAAALCLFPEALTLRWATRAAGGSPDSQLVAFLGGMLVRMALVLAGGLALYFLAPACHRPAFWVWVAVFYLFTLALETFLVVGCLRGQDVSGPPPA